MRQTKGHTAEDAESSWKNARADGSKLATLPAWASV
jgi:hypothetical protein